MAESRLSFVEIRRAFQQPLPPITTTSRYRIELMAVLLGLIVLQALYLLLIAIVCYVTWLYTAFAFSHEVSLNLVTVMYYAGPPIAGVIVTLFLLKPLIIRPLRTPRPVELTRVNEPLLFEFIEQVCRALGSPRPSRVFVDLRVNASASVAGLLGFFLGRLDLTIGLPLAQGMTLPQFTGVLAHEFGHFGQRTGLRSYFLIQTIQHWFARVVHQRDGMDKWLKDHCERGDWRLRFIACIATLAVTASRRYLALLMKAGAWMSASFSRQMEFNADLHEVAMVGFDVFEQISRQIALLAVGAELAWQDVAQERSLARLPDNFVLLTAGRSSWFVRGDGEKHD